MKATKATKQNRKKAFTLVELVIVIAVIAILAAVLIPTFSSVINSAKNSADQQLVYNLNDIAATQQPFSNNNEFELADNIRKVLDEEGGYGKDRLVTKNSDAVIVYDTQSQKFERVKLNERSDGLVAFAEEDSADPYYLEEIFAGQIIISTGGNTLAEAIYNLHNLPNGVNDSYVAENYNKIPNALKETVKTILQNSIMVTAGGNAVAITFNGETPLVGEVTSQKAKIIFSEEATTVNLEVAADNMPEKVIIPNNITSVEGNLANTQVAGNTTVVVGETAGNCTIQQARGEESGSTGGTPDIDTPPVDKDPCDENGHDWSVEWTWADDYSYATATFTCKTDSTHTDTKTDSVPIEETVTQATCIANAQVQYRATVTLDNKEYTTESEVQEKAGTKLEHNYIGENGENWVSLGDNYEDYHVKQCIDCQYQDETTKAQHVTTEWIFDDEDTHIGECDVCGEIYEDSHDTDGVYGSCIKCEYMPSYSVTLNNKNPEYGTATVDCVDPKEGGTELTVTITPNTGYKLDSLKINDNDVTEEVEDNKYIFILASDTTIEVTFAIKLPYFEKVTSANDLESGEKYLIVYETGKFAFNGALTTLDATNNHITVTFIENNHIILADEASKASTFTITYTSNGYTIQSASGYYIGQTSNANGLASSKTTTYTNTITLDESTGNVNVVSGGAYLRYNKETSGNRFRYYQSSSYQNQQAIQLYKLVEMICDHEGTIEFVESTATCTESGIEAHYTCTNCGKTFKDENGTEKYVPQTEEALGHELPADGVYNDEGDGRHSYTCGRCGEKGFAVHEWNEGVETTQATCTQGNKMTYTCEQCEATKEEDGSISALGHTAPTDASKYTNNGNNHSYKCERCQEDISAEHEYKAENNYKCICGDNSLVEKVEAELEKVSATLTIEEKNYQLPQSSTDEVEFAWSVEQGAAVDVEIDQNGNLTVKQLFPKEDTDITLILKASCGEYYKEIKVTVTIKAASQTPDPEVPSETKEATISFSGTTTTNMTGDNDAKNIFGLDDKIFKIYSEKPSSSSNQVGLNKDGTIRLYYNHSVTLHIEVNEAYVIESIKVTLGSTGDIKDLAVEVGGQSVSGTDGVYAINDTAVSLYNSKTTNTQIYIKSIVVTYKQVAEVGGGTTTPEQHTCQSACEECGGCKNTTCNESACQDKCQGHDTTGGESTKVFKKVTEAPTDWSGEYLIVYEGGSLAFDAAHGSGVNTDNKVSVTITNGEITWTEALGNAAVTLAKSGNGYTIMTASKGYFNYTANDNGLTASTTSGAVYTISLESNAAQIINTNGARFRYNTSSSFFRFYKSSTYTGQAAIQLYMLVTE